MKLIQDSVILATNASPPVRGRGLKRAIGFLSVSRSQSPPVRGRGLKHKIHAV